MTKKLLALITLLIASLEVFINLFPHWFAWKQTPAGYVFTNQASWFDPWDLNVYVAAVRWGQEQGFLMENVYASEPNRAIVYYPAYAAVGRIFQSVEPFLLFYIFSAAVTFLLVGTIVFFLGQIFKQPLVVALATTAVVLAGGLGFLLFPNYQSIDTTMTSVTFQSAFQRPHEGIALAAYITAIFSFFLSLRKADGRWRTDRRWRWLTVFSLGLTLFFYPYYLISLFLIGGLYYVWQYGFTLGEKRPVTLQNLTYFFSLTAIGLTTVGLMAYNLSLNPSFSGVIQQHLSSPTLIPFGFGYGVLLISFIFQLIWMRPLSSLQKLIIVWVIVNVALSVLPVGYARFFLRGTYLPLVIAAVMVLKHLVKTYFPTQFPSLYHIFLWYLLGAVSMTSLSIFYHRLKEVERDNRWYYMTQAEHGALETLQSQAPSLSGVLSDYYMGNQIPAHTSQRVYFGHLLQTPDVSKRYQKIAAFYSGSMDENEAREFLRSAKVNYVYWGVEENALANNAPHYEFLTEIYQKDGVVLYQLDGTN
jgi:hypothetical protein